MSPRVRKNRTDGLEEEVSRQLLKVLSFGKKEPRITYLLVALSGGPDSVALLHSVKAAAEKCPIRIVAAHVNYRLRGAESEGDERFCRDLCKALGVRLHVKRLPAGAHRSGNLQDWARTVRYRYFEALCERHGYNFIATGHTLDDNVETILMHLGRGAGTFGLSGMQPRDNRIIRPLLEVSREQVKRYLRGHRFRARVDSTNLSAKYLRNRLRRSAIPALKRVFGEAFHRNVARTAQILSAQESFLRRHIEKEFARRFTREARGLLRVALSQFRRYDPFLQKLLIARAYAELSGSMQSLDLAACDRALMTAVAGEGRTDLKRRIFAEAVGANFYFYQRPKTVKPVRIHETGRYELAEFGIILTRETLDFDPAMRRRARSEDRSCVYLDADRLAEPLTVRTARTGDRFQPLGLQGSKKLSDFFC